jgi:hypothetical protein
MDESGIQSPAVSLHTWVTTKDEKNNLHTVQCVRCGASGPISNLPSQALEEWNRGTTPILTKPDDKENQRATTNGLILVTGALGAVGVALSMVAIMVIFLNKTITLSGGQALANLMLPLIVASIPLLAALSLIAHRPSHITTRTP